jgi:hypothetical protein
MAALLMAAKLPPARLRGSGGLRTQRSPGSSILSGAPGQIPETAWRARADRAPHLYRCEGHLLSSNDRPLCVNGKGGWNVRRTESCRRQLPRPKKLRAVLDHLGEVQLSAGLNRVCASPTAIRAVQKTPSAD